MLHCRFRIIFTEYIQFVIMKCIEYIYIYIVLKYMYLYISICIYIYRLYLSIYIYIYVKILSTICIEIALFNDGFITNGSQHWQLKFVSSYFNILESFRSFE